MEGEAKGQAHDSGGGVFNGASVPLRRWEDWERSRLRKLKREERRRKDMERMHPGGFLSTDNDLLSVRTGSQYDGSDTHSLASSDDDHWGLQIGAYNENSIQYPPPPVGLLPISEVASDGKVIDGAEMEAMLDAGFDDDPSPSPSRTPTSAPRYQLSDNPSQQHLMGFASMSRAGLYDGPSTPSASSSTSLTTPLNSAQSSDDRSRRRPGDVYGPLGPLDPGETL